MYVMFWSLTALHGVISEHIELLINFWSTTAKWECCICFEEKLSYLGEYLDCLWEAEFKMKANFLVFSVTLCVAKVKHKAICSNWSAWHRFYFYGHIGVRAPSDLGGRWPSFPKKLHNARMLGCWNWDTNALKLQSKQTRSQFSRLMELL